MKKELLVYFTSILYQMQILKKIFILTYFARIMHFLLLHDVNLNIHDKWSEV